MNHIESRIEDLLVEWEVARGQGHEVSPEQLCADYPELMPQLREMTNRLRSMSWVGEPDQVIDLASDKVAYSEADTRLPDTDLSADEFVKELSDSGLLSEAVVNQVAEQRETNPHDDAKDLAQRLIEDEVITSYQARVILERGDSPLLLDRYIILDSIGAGGMGIVFKALHKSMERVVAIKVLPKHAVDSPGKVERFQREMRAAAKVSHRNVVQAFDAHESNGVYFFAMEFVQGDDLQTLVSRDGTMPAEVAAHVIAQAADGLAAAHDSQLIHRDVKPSNILLSDVGTTKVLDLGLVLSRDLMQRVPGNDLTRDGLMMGTVAYMSPEQAFDAHTADARSDIYSLGATLYFLLHGKSVFPKNTSVQTLIAHRESPVPQLGDGRNDVSADLEQLFQEMLAKDPSDRPQSMRDVRDRLLVKTAGAIDSGDSISPQRADTNPPLQDDTGHANDASHPFDSKRATWKWGLIAGVALLSICVGLAFYRPGSSGGFVPMKKWDTSETHAFAMRVANDDTITLEYETPDGYVLDSEPDLVPELPYRIVGVTIDADYNGGCEQLARLPDLKHLTVLALDTFAELPIPNLDGINQLQSLEILQIDGCSIHEELLSAITSLPALLDLHFDDCVLPDDLSPLTELKELQALSLYQADVGDQDLQWIGGLKNLVYLNLSNTRATTTVFKQLTEIDELSELFLTGIELNDDITLVSKLSSLSTLLLDGTDLEDKHLDVVTKLKSLSTLDVSHTNLSQQGVARIAAMPSLEDLSLQGLPVQPVVSAIARIEGLFFLDLSDTDLNDNGLNQLSRMRQLDMISVGGTVVTDAAIERFRLRLPNCLVVDEFQE